MITRGKRPGVAPPLCGACGRAERDHAEGTRCAGFVVAVTQRSTALRLLLDGPAPVLEPAVAAELCAEGLITRIADGYGLTPAGRAAALDRWGWILAAEACESIGLPTMAAWMWARRADRVRTAVELLGHAACGARWVLALERARLLLASITTPAAVPSPARDR